ncbi:hypothetical protein F5Y14DRAFT_217453 [Nemania sp. NC0429]|nr:hypothetical protein F5Y14DRAFT_217453 [Nemania sp. NC0429]
MSSSGHDDDSPDGPVRNPVGAGPAGAARRVKKKRVRVFTENDRAAHRIFEKSRREAFKEALTNLASLLPALADTEPQRLSKHVVVDESIAFIRSQHEQIRAITEHLETAKTERDELLVELNHWRSGVGIDPRQANAINHPPPPPPPPPPQLRHGDTTSAVPEIIMGAVPTVLQQHAESPMAIIGEATPSFIANPLHEPNPPSLPPGSSAGLWESFEPQLHAFENHIQGGNAPDVGTGMGIADVAQLGAYQTSQSPTAAPQFNIDRGGGVGVGGQHGAVFLPFGSAQPFHTGGF